MHYVVTYFQSS